MVQSLKFFKTNSVPVDYQANSVYLYRDANDILIISITDDQGDVVYSTQSSTHILNTITNYINSQKNIINGIAGVDQYGHVTLPVYELVTLIDGQNAVIKTDNAYTWNSMTEVFTTKAVSGTGNPSFGVWRGNFQGLLFSATAMNQVWCDFHLGHDYAEGTPVYPQIHWIPTTTATGVVQWGMEWCYADSYNSGFFTDPVSIYIDHSITSNWRYKNMTSYVNDANAINAPNMKVGGVIKMRIFRNGSNASDTYPGTVHAARASLHYQKARLGTKSKLPDFFI